MENIYFFANIELKVDSSAFSEAWKRFNNVLLDIKKLDNNIVIPSQIKVNMHYGMDVELIPSTENDILVKAVISGSVVDYDKTFDIIDQIKTIQNLSVTSVVIEYHNFSSSDDND